MDISNKCISRDLTNEEYNWIISTSSYISIDTETTGLNPIKDNLCLIQIYANEKFFLIKYRKDIEYTNLKKLFASSNVVKVFHHAIFDIRFLMNNLNIIRVDNVVCTKIAFKILNGENKKSSLKELLNKYLNIKLSKEQQLSDWSKEFLEEEQMEYAKNDVRYLIKLWRVLKNKLIEDDLYEYASKCFEFITVQAYLNNRGIDNIFEY